MNAKEINTTQEIQNILDRNFTRGDNAKALNELLILFQAKSEEEAEISEEEIEKMALAEVKTANNKLNKAGFSPSSLYRESDYIAGYKAAFGKEGENE